MLFSFSPSNHDSWLPCFTLFHGRIWCSYSRWNYCVMECPITSPLLLLYRNWDKYCPGWHLVFPGCVYLRYLSLSLFFVSLSRWCILKFYLSLTTYVLCQGGFILDMGVHFIAGLRMVTAFETSFLWEKYLSPILMAITCPLINHYYFCSSLCSKF